MSVSAEALAPATGTGEKPSLRPVHLYGILHRVLMSWAGAAGMVIVILYLAVALLAPVIAPANPQESNLLGLLAPPSSEALLGRDEIGRDILSRIIWGARTSILIATLSVGISLLVGSILGVLAGFLGRWVDALIVKVTDLLLAFPDILLAITLVAALGTGLRSLIWAVGIASVPRFVRVSRAAVLGVMPKPYIEAGISLGSSDFALIRRHVLPNALAPIVIEATLRLGVAILTAASLSFLGLGVPPSVPEWGSMMSSARSYVRSAPHIIVFPGLALLILVLGFNLLGDALRDSLDPSYKRISNHQRRKPMGGKHAR